MTQSVTISGDEQLSLLQNLVARALKTGADAADAVLYDAASLSLSQRLGKPEKLERAEMADLGLRVLIGQKQAVVSSSDRAPAALAELVDRAVAMARAVPEDPFCGLPEDSQLARAWPDNLDICDPDEPPASRLIEQARTAEDAAMSTPGVTNSDGAEASWSRTGVAIVTSNGFAGAFSVTRHSLSVSIIAGAGTAMEQDYDFSSKVYGVDLTPAAEIGRKAAERAVRRLNPRRVKTCRVPVVFDPRVAQGLLGHLTSAISGPSIARGTSFLKDSLGKKIFPDNVAIIDDPFIPRGLRSRPFDAEGLSTQKRAVVENGRLTTWLLDLRSARQLGLPPTGHASRGTSGPPTPSPSNLFLLAGKKSPAALIGEIPNGLYVTELLGMGVNGVTGDYSRGASGFWIENGVLAWPVSELTIASNLKDMFLNLEAADDLERRYGIDSPTLRIDGMTVAGL